MPVSTVTAYEQTIDCESVVEALVREHLTKKQYSSTLAAFQQEQQPLQHPINKRSILQDILGLISQPSDSRPSSAPRQKPSTLELQVQQLLSQQRTTAACAQTSSGTTAAPSSSLQSRPGALAAASTHGSALAAKQPLAGLQDSTQQQEQTWQRRLPAMQQHPEQQHSTVSPHSLSGPAAGLKLHTVSTPQSRQQACSGSSLHPGSASRIRAGPDMLSALNEQVEELVICDVELDEQETSVLAPAAAAAAVKAATAGPVAAVQGFQQLAPEQQRQLVQLVWGEPGVQPEAAWQQGFIWNDIPGLEWGLVQLSGGPCGVLAAVQAHLIATLMEQQLWNPSTTALSAAAGADSTAGGSSGWATSFNTAAATAAAAAGRQPTAEQLQEALVSSLALMLWHCASSSRSRSSRPAQVVMLPQSGGSSAGLRGLCDVGQVLRMVQVATAHSKQDLEVLVRAALPQWCQRKGWGLLLLVYSSLLSRSCEGARSDMDNEVRLVDGLGYCSMELVNLLLTGAAVSNVFDGCQTFGDAAAPAAGDVSAASASAAAAAAESELVIKGVEKRARVGLLTLFEWYRYVEVGQNLKSPRQPVWVVCSESHFSVLALSHSSASFGAGSSTTNRQQQQQQVETAVLKPSASSPLLLQFYDGLAKQEGPIVLELRPAKAGQGWSSRLEGVSEERGVWQGRPIPPLECVVETKWQDVAVTWHGSEPIL